LLVVPVVPPVVVVVLDLPLFDLVSNELLSLMGLVAFLVALAVPSLETINH
jgi:hypothetical protein